MKTCAIVGINWGDEGKGRMVDLLTRDYDVVVRYQGGGNAGHTVINEYGKFALHLLPSGIFRPGVVNVLGSGVALDLDYGIYPYTTSSNAVAAYAAVGSGLPAAKLDEVVGVVKAYSTCVGEGPFVCEWSGPEADRLREAGSEYGAKTGRPRRVGPFDAVATRYGVEIQGATVIALTKLDVLSYMDKIPVCTKYAVNGAATDAFPFPALLEAAKPVTEYLDGWKCDISGVRTWDKLPPQAQAYVEYVEKAIGCHIGYISVGPERDAYITR